MNIKKDLINSIAESIATYKGNIDKFGIDRNRLDLHVEKWLNQFNLDVNEELIFLTEMDHILKKTFITENTITKFLTGLVNNPKLTGDDLSLFWQKTHILNIQNNGKSQKHMVAMLNNILNTHNIETCKNEDNSSNSFIYLDDLIFSGNRMYTDLKTWIEDSAPDNAIVNIIVLGIHTSYYYNRDRLRKIIKESKKKVDLVFWHMAMIENRNTYKNESHVLWPVCKYAPVNLNFIPRECCMKEENAIFSTETHRQLLERIFTISGRKILDNCQNNKDVLKPLGYGAFGYGFGAMIFTYRNCPNNVPLAIWWGDPTQSDNPAMSWYPLLPRITYDL